jgi:Ran-binding protein 1
MNLAPNVGSDRSWVWNVAADYAEGEPTAETLAIRFANSDSEFPWSLASVRLLTLTTGIDANQFKAAFEDAQKMNESRKAGGGAKEEDGDDKTKEVCLISSLRSR